MRLEAWSPDRAQLLQNIADSSSPFVMLLAEARSESELQAGTSNREVHAEQAARKTLRSAFTLYLFSGSMQGATYHSRCPGFESKLPGRTGSRLTIKLHSLCQHCFFVFQVLLSGLKLNYCHPTSVSDLLRESRRSSMSRQIQHLPTEALLTTNLLHCRDSSRLGAKAGYTACDQSFHQ